MGLNRMCTGIFRGMELDLDITFAVQKINWQAGCFTLLGLLSTKKMANWVKTLFVFVDAF